MSGGKNIDRICAVVLICTILITVLFTNGKALGLQGAKTDARYVSRLFDTSSVHRIDIVMDDWDSFLETCENEEYTACSVLIDGEKFKNVGIRAKGNTSLSNVRQLGSQRYSFKIEFDHFETGKTYYGLDKLCLNNLIQDNTMMKDYLVYQMMADFGADAPMCSFVYITVNGEDWGLYLGVEGVEDSFLQRTYGSEAGDLYKPDSMGFGGGRGNGRDFDMKQFEDDNNENNADAGDGTSADAGRGTSAVAGGGTAALPETDQIKETEAMPEDGSGPGMPPDGNAQGGFGGPGGDGMKNAPGGTADSPGENGGMQGGPGGGGARGSDDVKLKYIDDDPDSYSNIFENAKTDVTKADKSRLIAALKNLNAYTDLEDTLEIDEVLRYFVVHNFVCNGDSYTGSMIHNYYLHEKDGKLSMIPWDYNLAFGTFMGNSASDAVNASIDSPVTGGDVDDRPMVGWIFSDEKYTDRYHELFAEFIDRWFSDGQLETLISRTAEMIRPYVEKDPTRFCTTEEFDGGIETMESLVSLRAEAVRAQLRGEETETDTGDLDLSALGTMGGAGRGGRGQQGNSGQTGQMPGAAGAEGAQQAAETQPAGGAAEAEVQQNGEAAGAEVLQNAGPRSGEADAVSDDSGQVPGPASASYGNDQGAGDRNGMRPAGGPDFPGEEGGSGTSSQPSAETTALLVGGSVLVLAAGILIAVRKKTIL